LFRSAATGLDLNFAGGVFSLNNTRTSNPANIPGWSFSRTDTNGTATALDLAGNVIQFATGVPRITNRGILVEEARTNLLLRSTEFDNASWTKSNVSVTANAIAAPDGTTTADKAIAATGSVNPLLYTQTTLTAASYTVSVYAKAAELTWLAIRFDPATTKYSWFDLANGVVGTVDATHTATITALANGWYRCTVTATGTVATWFSVITPTTANNVSTYTGNSVNGIYIWGAQLEAGAFATSPIITTGAAGTRGADAPRLTVVGGEKTVIVEGIAPTTLTATLRCLVSLTTADFATYVVAGFTSTGTVQLFRKSSIGNTTLGVTSNVVTAGAPFKFAFTFGTDGTDASCLNGGTPVTNTGLAGVYTFTELRPGWWAGDPGPFNAYDGRIRVFDRRVTAAELQSLTAP
jgi:hypothetical protein